jgi:hypothetical protein
MRFQWQKLKSSLQSKLALEGKEYNGKVSNFPDETESADKRSKSLLQVIQESLSFF